jgi:hypothetical protein
LLSPSRKCPDQTLRHSSPLKAFSKYMAENELEELEALKQDVAGV